MSTLKKLTGSLGELKNVYSLAAIAMLLALRVVLGMFANATLPMFGNTVKLSGAFLPIATAGVMFGPVPAGLVGALGDVVSFFLFPTPGGYFPGFTISGLLTGLIYGLAFYKNNISLPRTIIAWVTNTLLVETFLAAYWLNIILADSPYPVLLTARFVSAGCKCIPEILLIFAVGKLVTKIKLPNRLSA